ncbi:MAG: hypothetical protein A3E87_06900 [Gammaproteobacteria bacterium RIFCSPHIGHO2_12_FULL_35_23]|nr:MAG: hypothetical protein A3E87_06900 [Gammaproteobacteria bacterium RIFCSPHIGHO2_12_FULL_35_23]
MLLLLLGLNNLVLFILMILGMKLLMPFTYFHLFISIILSFFIIISITLLFSIFLIRLLLKLVFQARNPIPSESQRLIVLLDQVQHSLALNLSLLPIKPTILICDHLEPDAFAIGNNLILTRGLYETTNDEELSAIIAHTLGSIHLGESTKLSVALSNCLIPIIFFFLVKTVFQWLQGLASILNSSLKSFGLIMKILLMILYSIIKISGLLVNLSYSIIQIIILLIRRHHQLQVDKFTVQAGFGPGLLALLNKLRFINYTKQNWLSKLSASASPIMLRIGKIEILLSSEVGD